MGVVRRDHTRFLLGFKQQLNFKMLHSVRFPSAAKPRKTYFGVGRRHSEPQFDKQLFHVDRRRAGEMQGPTVDRMGKPQFRRMQGLTPEIEAGENRAQSGRASSIDRIAQ